MIWATGRNHPVGRAALAEAQLAYARYLQARAQRALDRRRPGWQVVALVLQGIAVASSAALAAAHSQQRVLYSEPAAGPAALGALGIVLESSRSLKRRADRMARSRHGSTTVPTLARCLTSMNVCPGHDMSHPTDLPSWSRDPLGWP